MPHAPRWTSDAYVNHVPVLTGGIGRERVYDFIPGTSFQQCRPTKYTHVNAPTWHIEANGISFAYRCVGEERGVPLVFRQHRGEWTTRIQPSPMDLRNRDVMVPTIQFIHSVAAHSQRSDHHLCRLGHGSLFSISEPLRGPFQYVSIDAGNVVRYVSALITHRINEKIISTPQALNKRTLAWSSPRVLS